MTLLYHHRTLADGAEGIHIAEMIRAFETLGYRVHTFAPADRGGGTPGVLPRLVRRLLPQGVFECAAAAHNLVERRQARRLLARVRPAFVYCRHALNDVGLLEAARERGTPSVLEVNTLYSSDVLQTFEPLTFRRLARRLETRALRLAGVVVAVSSPMRDLVHQMTPSARVVVIPNGANPEQFSPSAGDAGLRARLGLPEDGLVVGWSGVVRAWHRLDLLIEALSACDDGTMLLVIGDGLDRPRVERAATALGVGDRVRFVGLVPRDRMAAHLALIDIGVVADDRTGYASPMKLVEYMAMGKPVVAPDLPNMRDLVSNGVEGLLFAPGDARALAACLGRLSDEALRARLGAQARARVERERNWAMNARIVIDTIGSVPAHAREVCTQGVVSW
jgi:glycosyltransferase involved in cell wall biosynthesis